MKLGKKVARGWMRRNFAAPSEGGTGSALPHVNCGRGTKTRGGVDEEP